MTGPADPGWTPPRDPAWTIEEACAYFAEGWLPIEPARLQLIIRGLPEFPPVGQRRGGLGGDDRGGRGKPTYPVAELMRLQAALAPWLTTRRARPPGPGDDTTDVLCSRSLTNTGSMR